MKRMIDWAAVCRALVLSEQMAGKGIIQILMARMAGSITAEEADRLSYQLGRTTMTAALYHELNIPNAYN